MLFAGWEVCIVKDQDCESAALSLWPQEAFSSLRSPYGPTLSWQIRFLFFPNGKLVYKWVCLCNFVIEFNWRTCHLQTFAKKSNE